MNEIKHIYKLEANFGFVFLVLAVMSIISDHIIQVKKIKNSKNT